MENIIEISNLDKSFGEVHAVNDLSFHVKRGELFAFLGVNGAGKSTTISIMCGTLAKDKGKILIDGFDIDHDISSRQQTNCSRKSCFSCSTIWDLWKRSKSTN